MKRIAPLLLAIAVALLPPLRTGRAASDAPAPTGRDFALAKLIVLDLAPDGRGGVEGGLLAPMRALDSETAAAAPQIVAPHVVATFEVPETPDRALVYLELTPVEGPLGGRRALALADVSGEPRLVDAVEFADAGEEAPELSALEPLGKGAPLLLLRSADGAGTLSRALTVQDDRLVEIAGIATRDETGCGFRRVETVEFRPVGARPSLRGLQIVVREALRAFPDVCRVARGPGWGEKTRSATFRWDRTRGSFRPDSDALALFLKPQGG